MAHAVVVGAGIGGLTAAVALEQKGWTVTVFEQAPSLEPVGSGLAIAPNALKALDTIGVGDQVRKLSAIQGEAGIRRADGRWLSRTSAELATARYGDPVVLLLRTTLVDLLSARLSPGALRLGTTVESADPDTGRVTTNTGTTEADLVVAADGIRSRVRTALFPGHPQPAYAGVTSWRLVVPGNGVGASESWGTGVSTSESCGVSASESWGTGVSTSESCGVGASESCGVGASESWGRGLIFGVMPLADDLVYCYATATVPPGQTADDERAELVRLFGHWHDPIPRLLTGAGTVLRHDIHSLRTPLPAFHRGRIALLGDAAHPMTPNLGQGACQAIEDAVVLAHHTWRTAQPHYAEEGAVGRKALTDGLAAYSAARLPRTTRIVRRSATIGQLTQWTNPPAVAARNGLISLAGKLGPAAAVRQMDAVFDWEPPVS